MEPLLKFPDTYFEDEVRDGFYVSSMMKKMWAAQLEVYAEVAKVCEKHHIQHFADAGTLLGAIRHGGYIPWDDDFDICMKRKDFEKFLKVAAKDLPKEYEILSVHTTTDHEYLNSRITNSSTIRFDEEFLEKNHGFPYVAGIDIFAVDGIAPDPEEEKLRDDILIYIGAVIDEINKEHDGIDEHLQRVENLCKCKIDRNGHIKNQLFLQYERLAALYKNEDTDRIALIPIYLEHGTNIYKKQWYEHTIKVAFENTEIMVPAMYDAVLREKYGDYMKVVKGGKYHDYPCYKKQEVRLLEAKGIDKFGYIYDAEHLNNEERTRRLHAVKDIKNVAASMAELLYSAHASIKNAFDTDDAMTALQTLEACQSAAITIGTKIEESQGEGFVTVKLLEEYCELTYQIHELIASGQGVDTEQAYLLLNETLRLICESIENDIKLRKEAIFFTYKPSTWKAYEAIWKKYSEDPDYDVYVIPVPLYKKNFDESLGEMICDMEGYPDYVTLTSYQQYNYDGKMPDVMFVQTPYDEYNGAISVHPFFFSSNLKQYTKKLVYVPHFTIDEITPYDHCGKQTMEHFVMMPGIVHADKTYVQSEQMRDAYIECMCEFAGEDTRNVWEEKIAVNEYSVKEDSSRQGGTNVYDMQSLPDEWLAKITKEDGTYKKVMMYNVSLSNILQDADVMFDKMRRVFDTFKAASDNVTMLWRTDLDVKILSKLLDAKSMRTYRAFVDEVKNSDWGIYDASTDASVAVELCDAYYGDPARECGMCRNMGKPVMVQNVRV